MHPTWNILNIANNINWILFPDTRAKLPYRINRIAFPECVVASYKNLRDKTVILGQIARVSAIFRIEEIIFFKSPFMTSIDRKKERKRVETILSYIETPQYLRKWIFPIMKELAHAGELPPLATPHHPDRAHSRLKEGEFREGLVSISKKLIISSMHHNTYIFMLSVLLKEITEVIFEEIDRSYDGLEKHWRTHIEKHGNIYIKVNSMNTNILIEIAKAVRAFSSFGAERSEGIKPLALGE